MRGIIEGFLAKVAVATLGRCPWKIYIVLKKGIGGLCADHIASPPGWCRTILRGLPRTYSSSSRKREYWVDIHLS